MIKFKSAAHSEYSKKDFNPDELAFAHTLDKVRKGVWTRNSTHSGTGFSIPLPAKAGDSARFFPDFLWWQDKVCWAIDTTGRYLLNEKVRGKLVALDKPRVALIVRGEVDLNGDVKGKDGWTVVVARQFLKPVVEHVNGLEEAISVLKSAP
jgi:type III restriction enzyme